MGLIEGNPDKDKPAFYIDETVVSPDQAAQLRALEKNIYDNPLLVQTQLSHTGEQTSEKRYPILQFLISPTGTRAVSFDETTESGYDSDSEVIELRNQKRAETNQARALELARELRIRRFAHFIGRVTAYKTATAPERKDASSAAVAPNPEVA